MMDPNERNGKPTPPLVCDLDDCQFLVPGRTFKTGSQGWYASLKVTIGGQRCQVTVTAVVIGSKPKPPEQASVQKTTRPRKAAKKLSDGTELLEMPPSPELYQNG